MIYTEFDKMADKIARAKIDRVRTFADALALARQLLGNGECENAYDTFAEAIFCRAEIRRK